MRLKLLVCVMAMTTCSLALAGPAQADFTVDDLSDAVSVTAPDAVCDAPADDTCTLREAVKEANDTVGLDTITFSVSGTHSLTIGQLNPQEPLIIDGNGNGTGAGDTVIDGNDTVRLFLSTAAVTLKDIRLEDGNITNPGGDTGAAIRADAALTLNNVTVTSSQITGTGNGSGAGIGAPNGAVTLTDSTVSNNTISAAGINGGAGINAPMGLNSTNSIVSGNQITAGTSQQGGGISVSGAFSLDRTTVSGNSVAGGTSVTAGGLFNAANPGARSITNSTISGNSGTSTVDAAGGVHLGGDTTITNATFANNSAPAGGADVFASGVGTDVTAQNSIFGSSQACGVNAGTIAPAMPGHNIDVGMSCGFGTANGNMQNTNPNIFFAQAGSPLHTVFIPVAASPAIDNADPSCGGGLGTDHRGVTRPQGPACDIGAYERDYRDLNVLVTGSGTVTGTGINCVNGAGDCTHEFLDGSAGFVLTATPAAGFQFSSWSGPGCSSTTGNQCTVDTGNDQTVTANFTAVPVVTPPTTPPVATPTTPAAPKKCKKGRKLKKGKCVKKKRKKK
jgi:CSLREA domain-containing protein